MDISLNGETIATLERGDEITLPISTEEKNIALNIMGDEFHTQLGASVNYQLYVWAHTTPMRVYMVNENLDEIVSEVKSKFMKWSRLEITILLFAEIFGMALLVKSLWFM